MRISEQCKELEQRAATLGIDWGDVLKRADLHRATWDRWKAETHSPQMRKFQRVSDAVDEFAREREHAA